VGNHPAWELCRMARQMTQKPFFIGGLMVMGGYLWDTLRRAERPVSPELVTFYRGEQMQRLKKFLGKSKSAGAEAGGEARRTKEKPAAPESKTQAAAAGEANPAIVVGETHGN